MRKINVQNTKDFFAAYFCWGMSFVLVWASIAWRVHVSGSTPAMIAFGVFGLAFTAGFYFFIDFVTYYRYRITAERSKIASMAEWVQGLRLPHFISERGDALHLIYAEDFMLVKMSK